MWTVVPILNLKSDAGAVNTADGRLTPTRIPTVAVAVALWLSVTRRDAV